MTTAVVYHKSCPDGFGAAWAVSKRDIPARYYALVPGAPPPHFDDEVTSIYILDTAFSREETVGLIERFGENHVTVLDHHESSARELAGLSNCIIDETRSGAVLAWERFHPGQQVPELLQYVQDRDLWQWEMPDSRAVSAYVNSQNRDFDAWTRINNALRRGKQARQSIIQTGYDILRLEQRAIQSAVKRAVFGYVGGHLVPIANSPQHRSEIGNLLLERHPDAPFAAVYYDSDGQRRWSLRSADRRCNVAELAERYGGGGHANAAGFIQTTIEPAGVP